MLSKMLAITVLDVAIPLAVLLEYSMYAVLCPSMQAVLTCMQALLVFWLS